MSGHDENKARIAERTLSARTHTHTNTKTHTHPHPHIHIHAQTHTHTHTHKLTHTHTHTHTHAHTQTHINTHTQTQTHTTKQNTKHTYTKPPIIIIQSHNNTDNNMQLTHEQTRHNNRYHMQQYRDKTNSELLDDLIRPPIHHSWPEALAYLHILHL